MKMISKCGDVTAYHAVGFLDDLVLGLLGMFFLLGRGKLLIENLSMGP